MSKARELANLGNAYSDGALSNRNRVINGAMVIDQRNGGSSVAFTSAAYKLDRWVGAIGTAAGTTIQRSTTSPTGFSNSGLITVGTGASPVAGAVNRIYQVIEGYNISDFAWGTASASTVTLSFWVRSSVTGTFSGALYGASTIQSYPFTYTISAANTFEQKTITIVGPTTGTWNSTNGTGVYVNFDLGSGSSFKTTAGSWTTGTYIGVTGSTNLCETSGATFYLTGVQLEIGDTSTPFEHRSYADQLQACQRYYFSSDEADSFISAFDVTSGNTYYFTIMNPVTMRTGPTITLSNESNSRFDGITAFRNYATRWSGFDVATATGRGYWQFEYVADAEL
jgi:hypothetical protein